MTGQGSARNREHEWSSRSTSCPSGKWSYPTRASAKKHAKRVGDGLRPYRCDHCPAWHVGHKPAVTMRGDMSASDFHARRIRYAYGESGTVDR